MRNVAPPAMKGRAPACAGEGGPSRGEGAEENALERGSIFKRTGAGASEMPDEFRCRYLGVARITP